MLFFLSQKLRTTAAATILTVLATSCTPADNPDSCFVADTIVSHQDPALATAGYTIVTRQSGFGEKLEFIELYRGEATFSEDCKTSEAELLDKVLIDDDEGIVKRAVIEDDKLSVIQDPNTPTGPDIPVGFPIEIRTK